MPAEPTTGQHVLARWPRSARWAVALALAALYVRALGVFFV